MICDMEIAKLEITPPPSLPAPSDRSGKAAAGQTGPGSVSGYMIHWIQGPAMQHCSIHSHRENAINYSYCQFDILILLSSNVHKTLLTRNVTNAQYLYREARSWEHKVASLRGTLMSFFMPKLGKIIGMTRTGPRE